MATFKFSTLTNNKVLTFNPAVDTLSIDIANLDAAKGSFLQSGANLLVTYQGKTVQLAGVTLAQLSSTHVVFANGSKLLVGDNTPATVSDAANNSLLGTSKGDYLAGLGGNDTLNGGVGADTMVGGTGNDIYYVDNLGDSVLENTGEGTDTVYSSLTTYTLGANVENLRLLGTGNLNATGNSLVNILYANTGDNVLDGSTGIDTVSYQYGATAGVTVSLAVAGAQATVGSGSDSFVGIENLSGSAYADTLTGNSGSNILSGLGGADYLRGSGGNDTLVVPDLAFKKLDGGTGTDTLSFSGTGLSINLATLGSKLVNLEAINLNGGNALMLTPASVLNLSTASDTLVVNGLVTSTVDAGKGWLPGADAALSGRSYHTYTQAGASLWVETTIPLKINYADAVSVSVLNGANGFRLDGGAVDDQSGGAVSAAGDLNGDGYADIIVGAAGADPGGKSNAGSSYVVFGKASGFSSALDLAGLDGTDGFRMDGAAADDHLGRSLGRAGDVNGDGFADFILGADGADPNGNKYAGSSYVVFGKAGGFGATQDLAALNGSNGFRLDGLEADGRAGVAVGAAGDVNGDGFADLIVGALGASPNGIASAGSIYVVFGQSGAFAASPDLASLNGANGFRIDGVAAGDNAGVSVSTAGDVNGDGFADLIIGASGADPTGDKVNAGSSYVVFGKASGFAAAIDLSSLDGNTGFRLDGAAAEDHAGRSVSAAGDVNGDGYADIIVGAGGADPNGNKYAGSSYVVFGKAAGFAASLDLASLTGANGFRLDGGAEGDRSGFSVSSAGDVNGDGFDDLIVGAEWSSPSGKPLAGAGYLVFGKAAGFSPSLSLASLNGLNGIRIDGAVAGDEAGSSVNAAGDVNGDGFADLIVGAYGAAPGGNSAAGSSHILFGGNVGGVVTKLGASGADTLTGTTAAERFVGGQGGDTLVGGGGADVFHGGAGDDLIRVSDLNLQRADGGSGTDTLALAGSGLSLDLAAFRNQLFGIERIDLTGIGNNTLTALKQDVVNLSDTSNTLQVDGNVGDHYTLAGTGWVEGPDVTLVGVAYHSFDNGEAHVLLNSALTAV